MRLIQLFFGSIVTVYAITSALFYNNQHFYTYFTAGTFLISDWFDYKFTGQSILAFFVKKANNKALLLFLVISTFFCFLVDYLYGVKLTHMWAWPGYSNIHFLRMYLIMNPTFILGSYELYRIMKHFFRNIFPDKLLFPKRSEFLNQKLIKKHGLTFGILFLISPLYLLLAPNAPFIEYAMIFPFLSVLIIPDYFSAKAGKESITEKMIGLNPLELISLLSAVAINAITTEFLNIFAHEWVYLNMPFMHLQVYGVPVAVFFGWIPLVAGTIAIINLIVPTNWSKNLG